MKNKKTLIWVLLLLASISLVPDVSHAQAGLFKGVPCDGGINDPCDFNKLMELFKNIIDFAVLIAFPLAIVSFSYAGFTMMLNPDNPGKRKEAWSTMMKVVIGFGVLLAAWLIVKLILDVLLSPDIINNNVPIKF